MRNALSMKTVGALFWGQNFALTHVNEAFLAMTGFSYSEALGKTWQELTPPEFHPASLDAVAEIEARGEITPYEKQYYRADGSRFWGLFAARKVEEGVFEFVLDVTERKQAEAALHRSDERFRQFAEAASDVLWIRDAKTLEWEYVSPAFQTIYGVDIGDGLDGATLQDWLDLVVKEDRQKASSAMERLRSGEHVTFEFRIRRPDGEVRWLRNTDFPIRSESGEVEFIGGVGRDVTEQKQWGESRGAGRRTAASHPQSSWRGPIDRAADDAGDRQPRNLSRPVHRSARCPFKGTRASFPGRAGAGHHRSSRRQRTRCARV